MYFTFPAAEGLLTAAGAGRAAEHRLWADGLSSCGARALVACCMWALPG